MDRSKALILLMALFIIMPQKGLSQLFGEIEKVKYDTGYITIYRDDQLYGDTRYIDLQSHIIFQRYIVDFYLQSTRGFYLDNPENVFPVYLDEPFKPLRGDIQTNDVGLNVQYLFNPDRYSYRASFLQNQFPRKSAVSPIAGIEAYWLLGTSDLVTVGVDIPASGFLGDMPFHHAYILNTGVNGAYAYTFVWLESLNFFLSTVVGVSFGFNRFNNTSDLETVHSPTSMGLNNTARIALGYNSATCFMGLSFICFTMTNHVEELDCVLHRKHPF
ncbi:MAG: DUF4421 family protein [Bacteroidota bacterium]